MLRILGTISAAATLIAGVACAPDRNQPEPHTAAGAAPMDAPRVLSLAPLTAVPRRPLLVREQLLYLALPEPTLWNSNHEGTYFHAVHPETASALWVKRWRQGELVSPAQCQQQSDLWRPGLTPPPASAPVTSAELSAPVGYHTQVFTYQWAEGNAWHGQLSASGALIRDCFVYVYLTSAPRSPLGKATIDQRLNVMLDALADTRIDTRD